MLSVLKQQRTSRYFIHWILTSNQIILFIFCAADCKRSCVFPFISVSSETFLNKLLFIPLLPSVSVVIQDLHVKSFTSLSNFVSDVSHSNDPQSRACDFNSQQIQWYMGGFGVNSYLVTCEDKEQKTKIF